MLILTRKAQSGDWRSLTRGFRKAQSGYPDDGAHDWRSRGSCEWHQVDGIDGHVDGVAFNACWWS